MTDNPEDKRTPPEGGSSADDAPLARRRPWGPASYWRSGLVLLAVIIAVLLAFQLLRQV